MSKFNRGNHTSYNNVSSFSSNSFARYDDTQNDRSLANIPESAETLSTGLLMILDEQFVVTVWNSEKKREVLQDLLVRFFCPYSLPNSPIRKDTCSEKTF